MKTISAGTMNNVADFLLQLTELSQETGVFIRQPDYHIPLEYDGKTVGMCLSEYKNDRYTVWFEDVH